ncbi:MAG: outer membrane lipoprotein carrier protein LolA [Bacteroidetes bacterium]|nr:outer membrane lipoprotein carrier protein LolA [Bacteroidota bacterium]
MFKSISLAICGLLIFTSTTAQSDPKANEILRRSNAKVSAATDITASFSQVLLVSGATRSSKSGTLKMKQNKFRVQLSDQTLICNGAKIWRVLPEDSEVTVSTYDEEDGFSPERMFSISQSEMKSKYEGVETISGQVTDKISLFPTGQKDYWKIEMYVVQSTSLPAKMVIFNRTGSQVVYTLSSVKLNGGLADTLFSFTSADCPNCEVVQE